MAISKPPRKRDTKTYAVIPRIVNETESMRVRRSISGPFATLGEIILSKGGTHEEVTDPPRG